MLSLRREFKEFEVEQVEPDLGRIRFMRRDRFTDVETGEPVQKKIRLLKYIRMHGGRWRVARRLSCRGGEVWAKVLVSRARLRSRAGSGHYAGCEPSPCAPLNPGSPPTGGTRPSGRGKAAPAACPQAAPRSSSAGSQASRAPHLRDSPPMAMYPVHLEISIIGSWRLRATT